jgi:hypothetical protein
MLSKGGVVPTSVARIRGVRPVSPAARPLTIILELGGEVTLSMPAAGLPRARTGWFSMKARKSEKLRRWGRNQRTTR